MSEDRESFTGSIDIPSHALAGLIDPLTNLVPWVMEAPETTDLAEAAETGPHAAVTFLLDLVMAHEAGQGEVEAVTDYQPGDPTLTIAIDVDRAEAENQYEALRVLARAGTTGVLAYVYADSDGAVTNHRLILEDGEVRQHDAELVFPDAPGSLPLLNARQASAVAAARAAHTNLTSGDRSAAAVDALIEATHDLLAALDQPQK